MTQAATLWDTRMERLTAAVGAIDVVRRPEFALISPLVAVTSSRLGHDPSLHRQACRFLCRSMMDCRTRGGSLLVASGSAIEPWALRAAELFGVPVIRLSIASEIRSTANDFAHNESAIIVGSDGDTKFSRDKVLIALADRVDAVFVRRGGTIDRCLRERVRSMNDATTRVAVSMNAKCASASLISCGAIGWFLAADDPAPPIEPIPNVSSESDVAWMRTDGHWLVHCTRGCDGAWPGETERQYRDSILLGDQSSVARGPLDALLRIVRSGRIVAGATATKQEHRVVCFSAMPLEDLLQNRCFRPQLGRWDYEPYGVAIRLSTAKQIGIQSVVYGEPKDRGTLPPEDRYRFHPVGKTYDWRMEREWRSSESVDLAKIDREDIRVFAEDTAEARAGLMKCPWNVTFLTAGNAKGPVSDKSETKRV